MLSKNSSVERRNTTFVSQTNFVQKTLFNKSRGIFRNEFSTQNYLMHFNYNDLCVVYAANDRNKLPKSIIVYMAMHCRFNDD